MSVVRILHKLLTNGEHDELEDVVIVEGEFVEVDENGKAIRLVLDETRSKVYKACFSFSTQLIIHYLSLVVRKPVFGIPTRSDTNRAVLYNRRRWLEA